MTRTHTQIPVWVWQCDTCGYEECLGRDSTELPTMDEMRERGWFIAEKWGDKCPECINTDGQPRKTGRNTQALLEEAGVTRSVKDGRLTSVAADRRKEME